MRIPPDSMIQYACITRQKTINDESFFAPETNRNKSSNEACIDNDIEFLMNNFRYLSREMPKAFPQNLKSRRIAHLEKYAFFVPRSQVEDKFFPPHKSIFLQDNNGCWIQRDLTHLQSGFHQEQSIGESVKYIFMQCHTIFSPYPIIELFQCMVTRQ